MPDSSTGSCRRGSSPQGACSRAWAQRSAPGAGLSIDPRRSRQAAQGLQPRRGRPARSGPAQAGRRDDAPALAGTRSGSGRRWTWSIGGTRWRASCCAGGGRRNRRRSATCATMRSTTASPGASEQDPFSLGNTSRSTTALKVTISRVRSNVYCQATAISGHTNQLIAFITCMTTLTCSPSSPTHSGRRTRRSARSSVTGSLPWVRP